jgi:hypothetical protein
VTRDRVIWVLKNIPFGVLYMSAGQDNESVREIEEAVKFAIQELSTPRLTKKFKAYVRYVKLSIKALDAQMELPSSVERGRNIAKLLNDLEMTTDKIWHFELGEKL